MTPLNITGLYATILVFMIMWLAIRVIRLRMHQRVGFLDAGHPDLLAAIRIHSNAVEWITMTLILFACAESQHLGWIWLHALGIILVISRLLHVVGLSRSAGRSFGRTYGILGTMLVIIILGIYNIAAFLYSLKLYI
jgi:hypothetical protein